MFKELRRDFIIFLFFGLLYCNIEIFYRGYTHISMGILGGICGLIIGHFDEYTPDIGIIKQCVLGAIIITILEFIFGYVLNIKLGLNVWDYSNMKFNIMGQVCPQFTLAWFILSYPAIKLDNLLRRILK